MLYRSLTNLLDLAATDSDFPSSPRHLALLPCIMVDPSILSLTGAAIDDFPPASSLPPPGCRIIVAHHLPLRTTPDPGAPSGWSFSYNHDTLVLQLRSGLPTSIDVLHVGTLYGLPDGLDPARHDAITTHVHREFRCIPVLIPSNLLAHFYHGFCKHYLWPLLHYLLLLSPSSLGGLRFDLSLWHSYLSTNKLFTNCLMEVLNPDDDFVWIQDYHLLALPTFLHKYFPRVKLRFFLHSPFPSSEIFHTIIIIASSPLHRFLSLLFASIHPTIIFDVLHRLSIRAIDILHGMAIPLNLSDHDSLVKSAATSLNSKESPRKKKEK